MMMLGRCMITGRLMCLFSWMASMARSWPSVAGRSLACRVAVKLGAGLATDVSEIDPASGSVKRSHYSGNLQATMEF